MAAHGGKRRGARRVAETPRLSRGKVFGLAAGITLCVVAWGYLVWAAIDFGTTARDGKPEAWWWLALASVGAMACLFVALILISRLLGMVSTARRTRTEHAPPPGGRRAAR